VKSGERSEEIMKRRSALLVNFRPLIAGNGIRMGE
jgi:hypothetical protein